MLKAENLSVHFKKGLFKKKIKALDNFNLDVQKGDFFALIGQNGAGKSTAMYCFLGLIRPTGGNVEVFGETPKLGADTNADVAYLPEEPHYHQYLTVEEAVTFYGSLYGKRVAQKKVLDTLDRLGMLEFRDLRVSKCSKGMKQKVGIAQCIMTKPRLIFLDEPTRGLDPIIVKEFRDILVDLNKGGATIIINSHILSEIEMVANKVAIIDKGKVVVQDSISNLVKSDTEVYTIEYGPNDSFIPGYISEVTETERGIRGTMPSGNFHEFMDFAKGADVTVFECSHKKKTLEESYFNILKGNNKHA